MLKKIFALLLALIAASAMAAVDVNTASLADLDSVKGIGPDTSAKLLEARKTGKFKDWGDLIARVPGIGDKRAAKLSAEGLTVNGETYQTTTTASSSKAKPAKPTPGTLSPAQ